MLYYWSFYRVSVNEIHKLILKIQAGDWHSFDRPFLPQILLKAIQIQTDEIEPDYKEWFRENSQKSEIQIAEIKNLITNLTNRLAEKGM